MRNVLTIVTSLFASSLLATADVNVNWNNNLGVGIRDINLAPAPSTWLAQLIWTPDAAASAIDAVSPLIPTGGEQVLKSQPLNSLGAAGNGFLLGGSFNGPAAEPGPNPAYAPSPLAGGFVYTRVFNSDNSLYGDSAVSGALVDQAPPNVNLQTLHDPSVIVNQTIAVPEPGTYVLLGLGGLILWVRRLKK